MTAILRKWWPTMALGLILALMLALPKCEGRGSHPFTRAPVLTAERQASAACSRAYGQCQATEFIHVRANGTEWIETCFAAPASLEGHSDVRVAVDYCYRP